MAAWPAYQACGAAEAEFTDIDIFSVSARSKHTAALVVREAREGTPCRPEHMLTKQEELILYMIFFVP